MAAVEFSEHRIGERDFVAVANKRKFDEAFRMRDRKIAKQQGVDKGKDGYICADAQSKRNNCNGGEAGILPQRAQRVAEILPELAHDDSLQK